MSDTTQTDKQKAAALRKAKSREKAKAAGVVRLHVEIEIAIDDLIARVAKALGCSKSKVVSDLIASSPTPPTVKSIKWKTPDCNPTDADLTLTASERDYLDVDGSTNILSAGGIIEVLVNMNCWKATAQDVLNGTVIPEALEWGRLVYAHPVGGTVVDTNQNLVNENDPLYEGPKNYCKYTYRRDQLDWNTYGKFLRVNEIQKAQETAQLVQQLESTLNHQLALQARHAARENYERAGRSPGLPPEYEDTNG